MSKVFINPDKVEGLHGSFRKFESETLETMRNVDNYIKQEESYYNDVRKKMRSNLERAEKNHREAVTAHENAKRELDEAIAEAKRRTEGKAVEREDAQRELEGAKQRLKEKVEANEEAQRELEKVIEAKRRIEENNDSDISGYWQKIPPLKMREKEALEKVHECKKEVNKYGKLLSQCESLIAVAGNAVGQYRQSERTMNSILNDHTPAILIKLQIAVEKGRAIQNVHS